VDLTVERTASGGFGLVYMGPDRLRDGKWYALKTLKPALLRSPRVRELFVREALTWVGLWPHINLVNAHFVTYIDAQPYILLDYAPRGNLADLLRRRPAFVWRLQSAQMIAAGLDRLHTPDPEYLRPEAIVHRDLKPDNVLVDQHGYARITDFGLAKAVAAAGAQAAERAVGGEPDAEAEEAEDAPLRDPRRSRLFRTARGQALGTVCYMAPEQWEDAALAGPPADVYAFGLMLFELLAGRDALLDRGGPHSRADWRRAHHEAAPRSLREGPVEGAGQLPERLESLYQACLAKRQEERPTAAEALAGLREAAAALGQRPYTPRSLAPHTTENESVFWVNWAAAHSRLGLFPEAVQCNERALALMPHDPVPLEWRANILLRMGRPGEALTAYEAALAAYPVDDPRRKTPLGLRALALSRLGRYAEADAAFGESLAVDPEYADAWSNRGANQITWGEAEARAGRSDEARQHVLLAVRYLERALALGPNNPRSAQNLAIARRQLERLGG
jgi:serine/threonine protein kinase